MWNITVYQVAIKFWKRKDRKLYMYSISFFKSAQREQRRRSSSSGHFANTKFRGSIRSITVMFHGLQRRDLRFC